jgi:alginate O-acetyltransferase complex protein AlgI
LVFASHLFLGFLAILLGSYWPLTRYSPHLGKQLLIGASLVFYAWWIPAYLLLLFTSIVFNHVIVRSLLQGRGGRLIVIVGIAFNLLLIAYYKYAALLVETLNWGLGADFRVPDVLLPIGISFFTFQQISLLVDAYKGHVKHLSFEDHVFFVSFFPQLIAGPIVRQNDLLPQIANREDWRLRADMVAVGIALFSLGLFKESFLIDPIAPRIDLVYTAAAQGAPIGFADAWVAAFGYGFQIYFDFSAYSDMAIGLAFIFGIRLPLNFFSPYKAASVREFWRRWHITLSRFLRDYLFIPLGGSRFGLPHTLLALLVTMTLGGLWHGAAWTFALWGLLHGIYLGINHVWRFCVDRWLVGLRERVRRTRSLALGLKGLSILITFVAVNFAWILFRAEDTQSVWRMLAAMAGMSGWMHVVEPSNGITPMLPIYLAICWLAPNSMQLFSGTRAPLHVEEYVRDGRRPRFRFGLTRAWASVTAVLFIIAWFAISNLSPFIYFQF